jgi:selenium metabolism protein YedF
MKIDARGKACPQPVLMTKNALENMNEGVLTIIVDNFASKENVTKFLQTNGYTYELTEKNGDFYIDTAIGYECKINISKNDTKKTDSQNIVLYIASDVIGTGSDDLGAILMEGFIENIKEMDTLPKTIIFVNAGVFLTTKNEKTVNSLKELHNVEILSCGTCLNHFKLEKELKIGEITDAYKVMVRLFEADNVIRL